MPKPLHILILEDSEEDTEILRRLLLRLMVHVRFSLATNKEEFVAQLDQSIPDVILADNSLPQFDATEALLILRNRSLRIPFILVTGTVSEEFATGIIKLGADDYVLKDRLTRLPSAIDNAIKQCKAENEKQQAYSKLVFSEQKYRTLIERITDGFIALDVNWRYTYVNAHAGLLIRRDPKSLIGKFIWDEFPDVVGSPTYNGFVLAMKEQHYISNVDYYAPLDLWQENHIYPSPDGLSVFIRDITVRKKAEDEILQKNIALSDLSSHLQNIREQERIHIAREIHDDLGQQLTGLKMDMYWLQKKLINNDNTIQEKVCSIVNLIDETVKSVRRIASDLRPSMLDDLGLVAALEWHGQEVAKRSGLKIHFNTILQDLKIPVEIGTGIFRIYQEILTNVVRHANAKEIISSLELSDDFLQLFVSDDGRGMDISSANSGKTLGVLGIKERTYILGGNFEFNSEIGNGTEVKINIPYRINK